MYLWIVFIMVVLVTLGFLIRMRLKEQRYLKQKTSDAISEILKKEIKTEKEEFARRQEKFESKLKNSNKIKI